MATEPLLPVPQWLLRLPRGTLPQSSSYTQGLGGGASDWLPAVETTKHTLPHVKRVLPNAPQRCVTVSLGKLRPAWFNIFSFDWNDAREDREGILDSVRTIDGHIQDEIDGGIPAERIVVCGFSQGGATSLVVGLTQLGRGWKRSWLPLNKFREMTLPHLSEVPVFLCHNKGDPTVSYSWAQRTWGLIGELGGKGLIFRSYESNEHDVNMATRYPHIVNATAKHTATVIFLHGLGDSGAGWLPVVQTIKKDLPHIKWVLPNAPTRSITANFGMMMPGWFDIISFDWKVKQEDREGLLESARAIDKHIQDEVDGGIPTERIVLGGFSQGGAMSLLTGFTAREDGQFGGRAGWRLGGVAVLSGWLPLQDTFPKIASPHLTNTPVFMCHGTADSLVPYSLAQKTKEALTGALGLRALDNPGDLGAQGLSFRPYDGVGHEASTHTLADLVTFLNRALPQVTG